MLTDESEALRRVGEHIRAARQAAEMTQAQLAEKLGLTRTSIVNLEAGRQDIGLSRLAALTSILKLDLLALVAADALAPRPYVWVDPVFDVQCSACNGSVGEELFHSKGAAEAARRAHVAWHARNVQR